MHISKKNGTKKFHPPLHGNNTYIFSETSDAKFKSHNQASQNNWLILLWAVIIGFCEAWTMEKSLRCIFLVLLDGNRSEIIASGIICMTLHLVFPACSWPSAERFAGPQSTNWARLDIRSLLYGQTHPRHDQLSAQILNLSFHLAADVELMTVQGNSLQVGQQVLLARWIGALEGMTGTKRNTRHYGRKEGGGQKQVASTNHVKQKLIVAISSGGCVPFILVMQQVQ